MQVVVDCPRSRQRTSSGNVPRVKLTRKSRFRIIANRRARSTITGSAPASSSSSSPAAAVVGCVGIDGGGAGLSAPIENGTAANLAAVTSAKALLHVLPGQWTKYHAPAVNTQATISKAAVASTRHVCTWVSFTLANDATGSAQTLLAFNLRDGSTGAGTILASWTLALPATACECRTVTLTGLCIPGTVNTDMTLETAAAPTTHTAASVAFGGFSAT